MLCKRCRMVMGTGTTYEQSRGGEDKTSARRYYECKKCGDKIYTKEPNFQERMEKVSGKHRNI